MNQCYILGIDPGTTIMGYGVVKLSGNSIIVIASGSIQFRTIKGHFNKLKSVFEKTIELIDTYKPDELAIESQFFGKNVQSMLKLGRGQGVAIAAALSRNMPITEYAPRKIKQAITGNGASTKEQVADMLTRITHYEQDTASLDASDGLAVAVCHAFQKKKPSTAGTTARNWADFVAKNPQKVRK